MTESKESSINRGVLNGETLFAVIFEQSMVEYAHRWKENSISAHGDFLMTPSTNGEFILGENHPYFNNRMTNIRLSTIRGLPNIRGAP